MTSKFCEKHGGAVDLGDVFWACDMCKKSIALAAANEIADQFSSGFFDDGMVNHIAKIIERHIS